MWEYFSCVREVFVAEVMSFGERGGEQGEMQVANWHVDLNEIMACDAHAVWCVVCFVGGSLVVVPSHGRHRGVFTIQSHIAWCVCLLA